MKTLQRQLPFIVRAYFLILLLTSAVISSAPIGGLFSVLLIIQAVALYRPVPIIMDFGSTLTTFLLVPVALVSLLGNVIPALLLIPGLILFSHPLHSLTVSEQSQPLGTRKTPTHNLKIYLLALGSFAALGTFASIPGFVVGTFLLFLGLIICILREWLSLRESPIYFEGQTLRLLAESKGDITLSFHNKLATALTISVSSPAAELQVNSDEVHLQDFQESHVRIAVNPTLAGPNRPIISIKVTGYWGLLQGTYPLTPLQVDVIPRAQYANWLARRYLATTGGIGGTTISESVSQMGRSARGVEFQGLREYQPGDRLRDIDWRHTLKFQGPVVKEHFDPTSGVMVMLVNLVVADAKEGDWLAYNFVMSALSAAHSRMQVVIVAYDQDGTRVSTGMLPGNQALREALRLPTQLIYDASVDRLLSPPNIRQLRRITRNTGESKQSYTNHGWSRFVHLELERYDAIASKHPVTTVIRDLLLQDFRGTTLTIVSRWNHDAESLAVTMPKLFAQGIQVVDLLSERG